jgi:hypothetical protein
MLCVAAARDRLGHCRSPPQLKRDDDRHADREHDPHEDVESHPSTF